MHENDDHLNELAGPRKVDPTSKATGTNPKDLIGDTKVSISKFPVVGTIHGAHAMMDGARKYGPYNWRAKEVVAGIYIDAAMRHLMAWFEGEELATDSQVHHLGHAIACCAILLDAQETGNLVDDRPTKKDGAASDQGCVAAKVLTRLHAVIKGRAAKAEVDNVDPPADESH